MNGEIFDPGDLIAAIAHEITDSLDPDVAALGDRLADIESALDGPPPAGLRRLVSAARSQAISYPRFTAPQRPAVERQAQTALPWLDPSHHTPPRNDGARRARPADGLEARQD